MAAEGCDLKRKILAVLADIYRVPLLIAQRVKIGIALDFEFSFDSECVDDLSDADVFVTFLSSAWEATDMTWRSAEAMLPFLPIRRAMSSLSA